MSPLKYINLWTHYGLIMDALWSHLDQNWYKTE